ncbi:hypothetical protein RRF57_008540 [Xylaria bambusicola]|uniref:Uncharacterized protein n=1 Tax=Xylaria bambusicola TaxID=326684 RepID=A0AAN7ZB21_9PEZI
MWGFVFRDVDHGSFRRLVVGTVDTYLIWPQLIEIQPMTGCLRRRQFSLSGENLFCTITDGIGVVFENDAVADIEGTPELTYLF